MMLDITSTARGLNKLNMNSGILSYPLLLLVRTVVTIFGQLSRDEEGHLAR